jgi:adenylate kinase
VCAKCGGKLYQRADDNEETVKQRLEVYRRQTEPLIDYYKKLGKLVTVDGNRSIDAVYLDVKKVLNGNG